MAHGDHAFKPREASDNVIFAGATRVGLRNVGSYQVSGHPFITGSTVAAGQEIQISFPAVTKKINVVASGSSAATTPGPIRVHFVSTGSAGNVVSGLHFIELNSHEDSMEFDVKCKEIFISAPAANVGGFMLYASLTNIPTQSMYELTGSGVTE